MSVPQVGQEVAHKILGPGIIVFIIPNSRFPIKIHFTDVRVYCFFNAKGLQWEQQDKTNLVKMW